MQYPVYVPYLKGNEKKYVNECLDSSWISSRGSFIDSFEKMFAEYLNIKGAITVSNGTAALHLSLLALNIKEGDEVIVPTLTYIASANAIKYVRATPVFIDSCEDTWQMNHEELERKITSKTKAIIAVHLYGHPCEMTPIVEVCKKHNLFLIEDCAESIGSEYKGKKTGTFGDIAAFSFYGNKTITTGEGGMIVSNNVKLLEKVFEYKMQGVDSNKQYWHKVIGYNYKMTNICAAIGLAQLEKIEEIIQKKIFIADAYRKIFDENNIKCQATAGNVLNTSWMFSILTPLKEKRDEIREKLLNDFGIETRPVFYPVHTMPMYNLISGGKNWDSDSATSPASHSKFGANQFPFAEDIAARGINLPSHPSLSLGDISYISEKAISLVKDGEKRTKSKVPSANNNFF